MGEECNVRCEHYLIEDGVCLAVNATAPCYRKPGEVCVSPLLKKNKNFRFRTVSTIR